MESLLLSFNAICPIFLLMLLGYVLKSLKLADRKVFDGINKLVFKVFLPVLLFRNIYDTEASQMLDMRLMIFAVVGVLAVFFAGSILVRKLTPDNSRRGVMLQGFFRSNYSILGIPLVDYICGTSGLVSLMVAVVVPLFNALAVISLEQFRSGSINVGKIAKGVIANPLIIGCLVGMLFLFTGLQLPAIIDEASGDVAKIATPLAIMVLGASFDFSALGGRVRELLITVAARLVIVPLIAICAAVLLGFSGEALACIMVIFGSPVAVSSFTMAQQMGGDESLAAQVVVVSSAACLVTLFLWIFALNSLGLL